MAVSAVNTFTVTRDDIIKAALRTLGVIGVGDTPLAEDYTNCSQALNIMIKSWSKKGLPLWAIEEIQIPMIPGVVKYPLGVLGGQLVTEGITIVDGGSGGVDGTYTLGITDATGTGATGSFTVVDGALSTITITAAGSNYTAPTFTWSTSGITGEDVSITLVGVRVKHPQSVFDAFIRDENNIDTPLTMISRQEYNNLGNKETDGQPNQYYFEELLDTSYLYVYNRPDQLGSTIYAQTKRQFYDMNSSTDNFDFPQTWFQALKWGLAAEICVEYAVDKEMIPYFEQKAAMTLQESSDESVEDASVFFTVREY